MLCFLLPTIPLYYIWTFWSHYNSKGLSKVQISQDKVTKSDYALKVTDSRTYSSGTIFHKCQIIMSTRLSGAGLKQFYHITTASIWTNQKLWQTSISIVKTVCTKKLKQTKFRECLLQFSPEYLVFLFAIQNNEDKHSELWFICFMWWWGVKTPGLTLRKEETLRMLNNRVAEEDVWA